MHRTVCENKGFCNIIMPYKDTKILWFNLNQKSYKAPFKTYAGLECLIEKIDECKSIPENSSLTKVSEQVPSSFSMFTISSL